MSSATTSYCFFRLVSRCPRIRSKHVRLRTLLSRALERLFSAGFFVNASSVKFRCPLYSLAFHLMAEPPFYSFFFFSPIEEFWTHTERACLLAVNFLTEDVTFFFSPPPRLRLFLHQRQFCLQEYFGTIFLVSCLRKEIPSRCLKRYVPPQSLLFHSRDALFDGFL